MIEYSLDVTPGREAQGCIGLATVERIIKFHGGKVCGRWAWKVQRSFPLDSDSNEASCTYMDSAGYFSQQLELLTIC
jgi:hypothetical protein